VAKYDPTFWRRVLGSAKTTALMGTLQRLVENQEQKVTVALVDNFDEHDILESLLEKSKPAHGHGSGLERLDYLLRTPWRYPPLKWGSRFGRRFEPSLFYGSLSPEALFAEAAYYRLVFLEGMRRPFRDRVISQFTVFEAQYQTAQGLKLTRPPFVKHTQTLRHKAHYTPCQDLGSVLREREIVAITYYSARSANDEQNIALFSPDGLRSRKHMRPRHGLSETHTEGVKFRLGDELRSYARETFFYRGTFPQPATA